MDEFISLPSSNKLAKEQILESKINSSEESESFHESSKGSSDVINFLFTPNSPNAKVLSEEDNFMHLHHPLSLTHKQEAKTDESFSRAIWDSSEEKHYLHCLSDFFNVPQKILTEDPDAVLSLRGRDFIVLPNEYHTGETLFRSLGQAVHFNEHKHCSVRDEIINFIGSEEGWNALGGHIISFYENFLDEMKQGRKYYGKKQEEFYKRIYKHYLMNEAFEGSLIELVGASMLYDFNYTCMLYQSEDEVLDTCEKISPGKGCFRVIHSYNSADDYGENVNDESFPTDNKKHHYFLRMGESPFSWVWSMLLPSSGDNVDENKPDIPRGIYVGELWNVLGLNWNRANLPQRKLPSNFFCWTKGISVIATTSGKFLGGYTSLRPDLFTNLCWMLHGNLKNCDEIRCSIGRTSSDAVWNPSQIILYGDQMIDTIYHSLNFEIERAIGTLEDLIKAAKIYKFSYFVIAINEFGELYTLAKSTYSQGGKVILHMLVQVSRGVIMKWCALQDMRCSDDWRKYIDRKNYLSVDEIKYFFGTRTHRKGITKVYGQSYIERLRYGTKMVSKSLSYIQTLVLKLRMRNKVQHAQKGI